MIYKKLIIAAVLPMFIACTNDNDDISPATVGETVNIIAGFDTSTRTVLNNDLSVSWLPGDRIWINGVQSDVAKHTDGTAFTSGTASRVWFTATGNISAPYYCSTSSTTRINSSGECEIDYPTYQYYEDATTFKNGLNPSVAYTETGSGTTKFYNLCGIVKVNVTGNWTNNVQRIELALNIGYIKYLTGTASFTINPDATNPAPATHTINNALGRYYETYVVFPSPISLDPITPTTVYFVVPPNTYEAGWSVTPYNADGYPIRKGRTATAPLTVVRGTITTVNVDLGLYFASSNVYYDATNHYMTFDNSGNSNYQGVFFKWGSLVGVSPAPTNGSNTFDVNNTPIYVPGATPSTSWTETTIASQGWTNWAGIPPVPIGTLPMYANYNSLYDIDYTGYIGDICKYITESTHAPGYDPNPALCIKWRMPTYQELNSGGYGTLPIYGYSASGSFSAYTSTSDVGTYNITSGLIRSNPNAFFPASGYRSPNLTSAVEGKYCSASRGGVSEALWLDFNATSLPYIRVIDIATYACPIRCVKL